MLLLKEYEIKRKKTNVLQSIAKNIISEVPTLTANLGPKKFPTTIPNPTNGIINVTKSS